MDREQFEKVLYFCKTNGGGTSVSGHRFTIEQIIKMYIEIQKYLAKYTDSETIKVGCKGWWNNVVNNRVLPKDKDWMKENIPFIFEL